MKKLILSTTFLIAGTFGILAQGLVDFSNAPWEAWGDPGTAPDRLIYLGPSVAGGTAIADAAYTAALLENRGGTWTQLGDKIPFFGVGLEGIVASDGIQRVVSVPAGTATTLRIAIFEPSGLEMVLGPGNTAGADTFSFTMGRSEPPAPKDTLFVNMRAFSVVPVPEPSTVALGVLGLGALLLFRRRK